MTLKLLASYRHIPNILTILRLLGVPFILWIMAKGGFTTAFWLFLALCLTDWADGYLARRWRVTSKLGQTLDPLADKLLLVSVYLALTYGGYIPIWLTIFVVGRDVLILAIGSGILLSQKKSISLAPQFIGKVSTTLQMLLIGFILARGVPVPSLPTSGIENILMVSCLYSVALTTLWSGFTYARAAFTALRAH